MVAIKHLDLEELEAGLDDIRRSPRDCGTIAMIARRGGPGEREVVAEAQLNLVEGLVGDTWKSRRSSTTPDGAPNPQLQLTITNARAIALIAQDKSRWPEAGDQLYLDMDLSGANLPAGTRLALGSSVIEITEHPHNGCKKFMGRFGPDATKFVNSAIGKELHLRGINARVIQPGTIRVGDSVKKLEAAQVRISA
jgi:hypothetical protein